MEIHPGVACKGCRRRIVGVRHKCTVCPDYDLCSGCRTKGFHPEHQLQEIKISLGFLHVGVWCDGCGGEVRGIRFNCNDCFNYNLCNRCKARGTHSEHSMKEINHQNIPAVVTQLKAPETSAAQPEEYEAEVEFDYTAQKEGELSLKVGDVITNVVKVSKWWCEGIVNGRKGMFPDDYVKKPLKPTIPPATTINSAAGSKTTAVKWIDQMFGNVSLDGGLPTLSRGLEAIPAASSGSDSSTESSAVDNASFIPLPIEAVGPFTTKWSPAKLGVTFRRVSVNSSDQEHKYVIANMIAAGGQQWINNVKMVCRIENHRMYSAYRSNKEEMERENGPGFQNERILWHGTSADVLSNIYRDGFNRSYCGKNATAFGDGVYFATLFEYSASGRYSPPDSNGQKYIFQCRVLTGHFTDGQKGLKEPPLRTIEMRYDSVVNQIANPTVFVIFKDMYVYPEYVITLQV